MATDLFIRGGLFLHLPIFVTGDVPLLALCIWREAVQTGRRARTAWN